MATDNRIPAQKIVKGGPVILDVNSIDALFMDPSSYIGTRGGAIQTKYMSGFPSGLSGDSSGITDGSSGPSATNPAITPTATVKPVAPPPILDIVHLTDIESVTYEEYYDNGIAKYKCFIKIRNSSLNKNNVEGVDARIYNPNA